MPVNRGRHFVIADVHGHATALEALLSALSMNTCDRVTFLGDLIDGGADSRKVLDRVMSMGSQARTVMGNHESMLLAAMTDDEVERHWLGYGGDKTLASFGVERATQIPNHYRQWLASLPLWIEDDDYIFVHAGVEPDTVMIEQTEHTLLWQHQTDPKPYVSGKTVVSGHTPRLQPLLLAHGFSLDTGIANGGLLTAIELPVISGGAVETVVQVDAMGSLVNPPVASSCQWVA